MNTKAELVSTGAELLSGRSVNTHARLLGERLGRIGIALTRDTTVPDDQAVIETAVREAAERVDLVFVSGGLGPTNDDVTRDALARLLHRRIVMDEAALRTLTERMTRAGRPMNEARARQALVLEGAAVLPNSAGAAPGERIEAHGIVYFVLPGPPAEFQSILDEHVMPWLTQRVDPSALRERVLLVNGLGEADIVHRFEAADFPPGGIVTAYCAGAGRVEVRLHPESAATPDAALDEAADRAAALLGEFVYARERIEPEALIGRLLTQRRRTLATAESCTGGLIGERITSVSGSSAYYLGGVISYADEVKIRELGVAEADLRREGAVSEIVARQMAEGVRRRFRADYGVAVTGIAGPTGGSPEKPVGLVFIALAHPGGADVARHVFPGNRETIREWTCRAALLMLAKTIA